MNDEVLKKLIGNIFTENKQQTTSGFEPTILFYCDKNVEEIEKILILKLKNDLDKVYREIANSEFFRKLPPYFGIVLLHANENDIEIIDIEDTKNYD